MTLLLEKPKNIKVLFIGVSKDNPYKAIVVVQAEEGVIGKHIQENFDNLKKMAQIMSTAIQSTWLKRNVSYFNP
tara:strand:- start:30 stop:251 length:222 start_codon:yes stop_codon:yes gene_type:complete